MEGRAHTLLTAARHACGSNSGRWLVDHIYRSPRIRKMRMSSTLSPATVAAFRLSRTVKATPSPPCVPFMRSDARRFTQIYTASLRHTNGLHHILLEPENPLLTCPRVFLEHLLLHYFLMHWERLHQIQSRVGIAQQQENFRQRKLSRRKWR